MYNTLDIGLFKNIQYIMWKMIRFPQVKTIHKGKNQQKLYFINSKSKVYLVQYLLYGFHLFVPLSNI